MPTAIILWVCGALFAFAAGASAFQLAHGPGSGIFPMVGDAQHMERWLLWGAITRGLSAICCFFGWYLMRRRVPNSLALGAIFVMIAAFIDCQRAVLYLIRGAGFGSWFDLIIVMPLSLYAIIYAHLECRRW